MSEELIDTQSTFSATDQRITNIGKQISLRVRHEQRTTQVDTGLAHALWKGLTPGACGSGNSAVLPISGTKSHVDAYTIGNTFLFH